MCFWNSGSKLQAVSLEQTCWNSAGLNRLNTAFLFWASKELSFHPTSDFHCSIWFNCEYPWACAHYLAVRSGLTDSMVGQAWLVPRRQQWLISTTMSTETEHKPAVHVWVTAVNGPLYTAAANEYDISHSPHLDHWSATLHCDQFMALLVHQQFAVDAFVTLSPQTPDTVCADGTVGSLQGRGRKITLTNKHTFYSPRSYRGCDGCWNVFSCWSSCVTTTSSISTR